MSKISRKNEPADSARKRLPRELRLRQLLHVSWQLIRDDGTDALTLGRLAEAAGVTKPVVYSHFGTRNGLLAALYEDYDVRQTALIDEAIAVSGPRLEDKARVIAQSYINCVLTQGREIPEVLAALHGSSELASVKSRYQHAFIKKTSDILSPFARSSGLSLAALWAMLGAADALSNAAVAGEITREQASAELKSIILAMVSRA